MKEPVETSLADLLQSHELFLFDAFGVLIDGTNAFPEAIQALETLNERGTEYFVLTNDASKTVDAAVTKYTGLGLPLSYENIISSGMLVTDYFRDNNLFGATTLALGPEDSLGYITDAGGQLLEFGTDAIPDAIVILDDKSERPLQESMRTLITTLNRAYDRGFLPHLLLANPDLIYPSGDGCLNMAAGSVANMLEEIIQLRFLGQEAPTFTRVGKPYSPIFEKALTLAPNKKAVMIGDQLATDSIGAKSAGIDAALVLTGISNRGSIADAPPEFKPDFILESLQVS